MEEDTLCRRSCPTCGEPSFPVTFAKCGHTVTCRVCNDTFVVEYEEMYADGEDSGFFWLAPLGPY